MEHLIEHLKSANENRKRLKSEIKDIRPLVFLYKDEEATLKYDSLIEKYKEAKRELYSIVEQIIEQS